ncbi:hypothetical protein ACLWBD_07740 [Bdellovibrio sp. HCB117]|uniref:hypothetical protein n=1 Tax=Bdellovibrio sp. HCB117 TaxID=3394359 RepID=UPI0039B69041
MAQREDFIRAEGKTRSLTLKWNLLGTKIEVFLDQKLLGTLRGWNEIFYKGATFPLSDGSKIFVKWSPWDFSPYYKHTTTDSESTSQPSSKDGYVLMACLGGLNFLIGSIVVFGHVEAMAKVGFGFYNFFSGSVYLVLALAGWDTKSRSYLKGAFGFFLFETVMNLLQGILNPGGIIMRALLIRLFWLSLKNPEKPKVHPSDDIRKAG